MPDNEENLQRPSGRQTLDDRIDELERRLVETPFSDAEYIVLLQKYVDLLYVDALRRFGPDVVNSAEGRSLIETRIELGLFDQSGIPLETALRIRELAGARLRALTERPSRGVVGDDPPAAQIQQGADPVMLFSGQFVLTVTDVRIDGAGLDFTFRRTYKNQAIHDGSLGANWTHSYDLWLREAGDVVFRATGTLREDPYLRHPRFGDVPFDYFVPPDGQDDLLVIAGDSFTARAPDGLVHVYERDSARPFLHRVRRIEDRHGNHLRFDYDNGGRLVQMAVNHPERLVAFAYDVRNRLIELRDYTGRVWRYSYDDHGNLAAVTTPATDAFPDGLTTCYEYSSGTFTAAALRHNLTGIIEPSGERYLQNEYGTGAGLGEFNRLVLQRVGGGEMRFEYEDVVPELEAEYPEHERPAHRTIAIDRNGQAVRHVFNALGNLLLREEVIRDEGRLRALITRHRFNGDGRLIASLTPEGVLTQYVHGRDDFVRRHGVVDDRLVGRHPELTGEVRQGFGRLLATVQRADPVTFPSLDLSAGAWHHVFPDPYVASEPDVVVKMTYEPVYGQLQTVSDPRFTRTADSAAQASPVEHPRYAETLTRFAYSGPPGDASRNLAAIERPAPALPDGSPGAAVRWTIELDARGRLARVTDPVGTVRAFEYVPGGIREGYVHRTTVDPGHLALSTTYQVDVLGRVTEVRSPKATGPPGDRFVTRLRYNELDQLIERVSSAPFRFGAHMSYDGNGRLIRTADDALDDEGRPHADGPRVTTFGYDREGLLVHRSEGGADPERHLVTRYCHDASGRSTLTVLPRGNRIATCYDERHLRISETAGDGSEEATTLRYEYDGDGRLRRTRDGRGHAASFELDAFGRVTAIEDPLGHVLRRTYDKRGLVTCERLFERVSDAAYVLLSRREITYDVLDRPLRVAVNRFDTPPPAVRRAALATAFLEAPGPGRQLVTEMFHDAGGRVERVVDPLGREQRFAFDALDRLALAEDPLGNEVRNHYDAHDNLVRRDRVDLVRDPTTNTPVGRRVFSSSFTYDELDRLVEHIDSLGRPTRFAYDSRDNLVGWEDPLGNRVRVRYDIHERVLAAERARTDSGLGDGTPLPPAVTLLDHDANGNVTTITDPLGRQTTFELDALDRRRRIIFPDGSADSLTYDPDGHLILAVDATGCRRAFTVDALGRTIRVDADASAATSAVHGATSLLYGYDAAGRLRHAASDFVHHRFDYNSLGWPIRETTTGIAPATDTLVLQREYSDSGATTGLVLPHGRSLRLHRDSLDRLVRIENLTNGTSYPGDPGAPAAYDLATFDYLGRHRGVSRFGNGASARRAHDPAGRLIEIVHAGAPGRFLTLQYLYDGADNVRLRNEETATGLEGNLLAYDSFYRLVHEQAVIRPLFDTTSLAPADALPEPTTAVPDRQSTLDALIGPLALPAAPGTYTYDLAGNRTGEQTPVGAVHYAINRLDQVVAASGADAFALHYDARGRLAFDGRHGYVYDAFDRPVTVSDGNGSAVVARFTYDALGRRFAEEIGGVTTHIVYDRSNPIAEYRDEAPFAQYVYDDGVDRPLQIAAEGTEHWFHADAIGSVRALTDRAGNIGASYRYRPFGEILSGAGAGPYNPLRYAARRLDPVLGTYDNRARQYDPRLGRFRQRDPLGMVDGTNLYVYAGNNPSTFADPYGTDRETPEDVPREEDRRSASPSQLAVQITRHALSAPDYPRRVANTLARGNRITNIPRVRRAADAAATRLATHYTRLGSFLERRAIGRWWLRIGRSLDPQAARGTRYGWTGVWDVAAPVIDFGARLVGAPEEVTSVTGAGAELTSGAGIVEGIGNLLGTLADVATQGREGVIATYEKNVRGHRGAIIQGYTLIGDALVEWNAQPSGRLSRLLTSREAERGELGIFVATGNFWGEVLAPTSMDPFDYPREYIFKHMGAGLPLPPRMERALRRKLGDSWPTPFDYPQWLRDQLTWRAARAAETQRAVSREPWNETPQADWVVPPVPNGY